MIKGRVHSIETFGTVDGPGIRFILFMQGCPLRCKYCHNRDTWDVKGGTEYTTDEIISQALKYSSYMRASGGGITVSGGEATLQPEFLAELFESIAANPKTEVKVDLPAQTITNMANGKSETFEINPYKKHCLINALDDIEYLLSKKEDIEAYEAKK